MLPRKNRIPKKDFPSSQRQGVRIFSPFFSGVFYKNENRGLQSSLHTRREPTSLESAGLGTRVAVVVSKKTAKNAVTRNLIRRRFYEILGLYIGRLAQQGSIVLYPKKETSTTKFSVLNDEVETALRNAKLI